VNSREKLNKLIQLIMKVWFQHRGLVLNIYG